MEKEISENQTNQVDSIQAPVVVEKKKPNTLLVVILLIAILLVGVGGVYAGMQIGKKQAPFVIPPQTEFPTLIPTQISTPTSGVISPTNTTDSTANWKTYTSTKYGFKLDNPGKWVLKTNEKKNDLSVWLTKDDMFLTIFVTGPDFATGMECAKKIKEEQYLLDGQITTKAYWENFNTKGEGEIAKLCRGRDTNRITIRMDLSQNNFYYYISFSYNKKPDNSGSEETFDQILSTFKFLE